MYYYSSVFSSSFYSNTTRQVIKHSRTKLSVGFHEGCISLHIDAGHINSIALCQIKLRLFLNNCCSVQDSYKSGLSHMLKMQYFSIFWILILILHYHLNKTWLELTSRHRVPCCTISDSALLVEVLFVISSIAAGRVRLWHECVSCWIRQCQGPTIGDKVWNNWTSHNTLMCDVTFRIKAKKMHKHVHVLCGYLISPCGNIRD